MDTALPQKFPFILDRNLAKANCTRNQVCTPCDIVVVDIYVYKTIYIYTWWRKNKSRIADAIIGKFYLKITGIVYI